MKISRNYTNGYLNSKNKVMRKTLMDKRVSLDEAIDLIHDESCVLALGGVTLYRRPMAFALALLAHHLKTSNPHDLTLLSFTAGIESDILVGAGMVSKIRTCYFGLEAFGFAPHFTTAAAKCEIQVIEETEASLAFGIRATLAGVGFMPSHAWQGTELFNIRPDVKRIQDPYTKEELTAFPAVHCDVAVIHALEADPQGNARIGDNWGVDRELSLASDQVIITTEKISPRLSKADIIGPAVDAVVEAPMGAWPTSCHPLYPLDSEMILNYTETAGQEGYPALIQEWCNRHHIEISL
jgi:glutaconate CoA-transferase subunit A